MQSKQAVHGAQQVLENCMESDLLNERVFRVLGGNMEYLFCKVWPWFCQYNKIKKLIIKALLPPAQNYYFFFLTQWLYWGCWGKLINQDLANSFQLVVQQLICILLIHTVEWRLAILTFAQYKFYNFFIRHAQVEQL